MKTIGIFMFCEVEELDAIGPWEVLSWWTRNHPEDGYEVILLSQSVGLVQCAKGLEVQTHHSLADAPHLEVLIYPGGAGTRAHLNDPTRLDWIVRQRSQVPLLASVCTGSLVFAAAGLLKGRPATTHGASIDRLRDLDPSIDVQSEKRFVDDGDVITSAGVSAGIDMALHLVDRLAGTERAQLVRRGIQYDPDPPI